MKFAIKNGTGANRCSLRFWYEDYSTDLRFRSYDEALEAIGSPNEVYLAGYIHNYYYNCTECVQSLPCNSRPTVSSVKKFIKSTLEILNW